MHFTQDGVDGDSSTSSLDPSGNRYNHGYSWEFQDTIGTRCGDQPLDCYWAFNTDFVAGNIYFSFTYGEPSNTIVSFETEYTHTWDETYINSISVGENSAGFGWENQGHQIKSEDYANLQF